MSAAAKRQIIQILDELSEQNLDAVVELVDSLRAKAVAGPAAARARVGKLGDALAEARRICEEEGY
jgi:hypothetical protein